MATTLYTAQCPHCLEKVHWGETSQETRSMPERCSLCFEPFSPAECAAMRARAEIALGEESFHFPAEG